MRSPGEGETSLGGARRWFPTTTAGFVERLKAPDPLARRLGADTLSERYWKPVYHYLRSALARGNEDAKDLAQAYFAWLLERDLLSRYDPAQGSFRAYFKGLLRNFLGNREHELRALKRGGALKILSLDAEAEALRGVPADPGADPEALFDRLWMDEMVGRAVARVRARCDSDLRLRQFQAFERHDLADDPPTCAQVAASLGVKESDVENYLVSIRKQVRREVIAELAESGADAAQIQDEWDAFSRS